jgi:hypothetical protein
VYQTPDVTGATVVVVVVAAVVVVVVAGVEDVVPGATVVVVVVVGLHPVGVVETPPCVVFPIPGSSASHAAFRPVTAALLLA